MPPTLHGLVRRLGRPRIQPTSAIIGTGLKKRMPMNFTAAGYPAASWCDSKPARCCRQRDGVSGNGSRHPEDFPGFGPGSPVAASIVKCQHAGDIVASPSSTTSAIAAAFCSLAVIFSFLTGRSGLPETVATPFAPRRSLMSIITAGMPGGARLRNAVTHEIAGADDAQLS